jgi:hypothetical protein
MPAGDFKSVTDIRIERANFSHVDGILKLAEENYAHRGGDLTGTLEPDSVRATIQTMPSIVASHENRVIGFLLTWEKLQCGNPAVKAMLEAYPGSDDSYIYGPVCVEASARGKELAGAMFERLIELLPGREGVLFIRADNMRSLRAHRKMGMLKSAEFTYSGARYLIFTYKR